MIAINKNRSRRLQKKLHLGDFKEFGFQFAATHKAELDEAAAEALVGAFLQELVEPRNLAFAGWADGGFIVMYGKGSATAEDQEALRAWFAARPEVASVEIGPLVDAWR
jgi:hypothetical protein